MVKQPGNHASKHARLPGWGIQRTVLPCVSTRQPSLGLGTLLSGLGPKPRLGDPKPTGFGIPGVGLGSPSLGLALPSLGLESPSLGLRSPSLGLGSPSLGLGFPSLGLGPPSVGLRSPGLGLVSPSRRRDPKPRLGLGTPSLCWGFVNLVVRSPSLVSGFPSVGLGVVGRLTVPVGLPGSKLQRRVRLEGPSWRLVATHCSVCTSFSSAWGSDGVQFLLLRSLFC